MNNLNNITMTDDVFEAVSVPERPRTILEDIKICPLCEKKLEGEAFMVHASKEHRKMAIREILEKFQSKMVLMAKELYAINQYYLFKIRKMGHEPHHIKEQYSKLKKDTATTFQAVFTENKI